MMVVMEEGATDEQVARVVERIQEVGAGGSAGARPASPGTTSTRT